MVQSKGSNASQGAFAKHYRKLLEELLFGAFARFTRTAHLAILYSVKVFRIDQPLTPDFYCLQASGIDHLPHSARRDVQPLRCLCCADDLHAESIPLGQIIPQTR
jgi:hypothetical protein